MGRMRNRVRIDLYVTVDLQLEPKPKLKLSHIPFALDGVLVKSVSAKGMRMSNREVKKVSMQKHVEPDLFSQKKDRSEEKDA